VARSVGRSHLPQALRDREAVDQQALAAAARRRDDGVQQLHPRRGVPVRVVGVRSQRVGGVREVSRAVGRLGHDVEVLPVVRSAHVPDRVAELRHDPSAAGAPRTTQNPNSRIRSRNPRLTPGSRAIRPA
jgi:hypothetical protein